MRRQSAVICEVKKREKNELLGASKESARIAVDGDFCCGHPLGGGVKEQASEIDSINVKLNDGRLEEVEHIK